jgi:hypothetical protein
MGKKSSSTTYTSKGERRNISKAVRKLNRRDYMQSLDRATNQSNAWRAGKRVMLTVPNPNKNETNKRFIRVEAKDYIGMPGGGLIIK